jgi:hypothetical protein
MNALEWFRLAVRLLGLVFLYRGLENLPPVVLQFFSSFFGSDGMGLLHSLILGVWPLVVAYWLIMGAPWLIRRAFPESIEVSKP